MYGGSCIAVSSREGLMYTNLSMLYREAVSRILTIVQPIKKMKKNSKFCFFFISTMLVLYNSFRVLAM